MCSSVKLGVFCNLFLWLVYQWVKSPWVLLLKTSTLLAVDELRPTYMASKGNWSMHTFSFPFPSSFPYFLHEFICSGSQFFCRHRSQNTSFITGFCTVSFCRYLSSQMPLISHLEGFFCRTQRTENFCDTHWTCLVYPYLYSYLGTKLCWGTIP